MGTHRLASHARWHNMKFFVLFLAHVALAAPKPDPAVVAGHTAVLNDDHIFIHGESLERPHGAAPLAHHAPLIHHAIAPVEVAEPAVIEGYAGHLGLGHGHLGYGGLLGHAGLLAPHAV